jgi:adenylosuccinate lyase
MLHKGMSESGVIIGNPEDFENICAQYRAVMPHIITVLLNQECEHNRDLRNSAAERFYKPEILNAFVNSTRRCNTVMKKLRPNEEAMRRRVETAWHLLMEPAYIALALNGEPEAQSCVRAAVKEHGDFRTALEKDGKLNAAISALPPEKSGVFDSPLNYIGDSREQVENVVEHWRSAFLELERTLPEKEDGEQK